MSSQTQKTEITVGFVALGCPKAVVDSEKMLAEIAQGGYIISADPTDSDVVVINTCGFIAPAKQEALDAIQRAVDIRERLAAQRPDPFEPDLAMSLGALGSVHRANDNSNEALDSFRRGIEILKPHFLRLPQAFARLMNNLLRAYLEAREETGSEPDMDLLQPILEKLKDLESQT